MVEVEQRYKKREVTTKRLALWYAERTRRVKKTRIREAATPRSGVEFKDLISSRKDKPMLNLGKNFRIRRNKSIVPSNTYESMRTLHQYYFVKMIPAPPSSKNF